MTSQLQRKLTTILAADAVGYSSGMERDEVGTFEALQVAKGVFARFIERHHGRIANTAGDGLIADFPSVVEAVQCAMEVQRELAVRKAGRGADLPFRIGIHLGDVMVDGDDLLGEGVNLASRLESMAEPGGVLISQQVYDQVHAKLSVGFDYMGEQRPKNYAHDIAVYAIAQGKNRRPGLFRRRREGTVPSPPEHRQEFSLSNPMSLLHSNLARPALIVVGLTLLNIVTWSGTFWAGWPIAVLVFITLYRNLGKSRQR